MNRARICPFLLGVCLSAYAATPTIESMDPVLNRRVDRFVLSRETILEGVKKLSAGRRPFAFGFELPLRAAFGDVEVANPMLNLDSKDKTVRELLDTMCLLDGRYVWSLDGSFINVYPKATMEDSHYLMNKVIPSFSLVSVTDINQALFSAAAQLPLPLEQVSHVQAGGDSSYSDMPWTESFGRVTMRQAINRLCAHLGPGSYWILRGARDFRGFGFFRR